MSFAQRVITTVYRRMVVVTKEVQPRSMLVSADIPVDIRPIKHTDIEEYTRFKPFQRRAEVEQRLAQGHLCFAAFHDGRIAHAGWAATGRAAIPYIHSDIVLGPRDFYIYDSYTDPRFRRARLVVARSSAMHVYFSERGFQKSYGVIAFMNRGGLAVLEPAGYRRIGMYGCVRVGPFHRTWAFDNPSEPLPLLEEMRG